jgi:hypothetical protein
MAEATIIDETGLSVGCNIFPFLSTDPCITDLITAVMNTVTFNERTELLFVALRASFGPRSWAGWIRSVE